MMNLVRFIVILALLVVLGCCPAVSAADGPDTGFLTVLSIPSGASVQVDGKEIGTTPLMGIPVEAGAHTLSTAIPGFSDHTESFTLSAGEQKSITIDLSPIGPTPPITEWPTMPVTTVTAWPTIPETTVTIPTFIPETTITIPTIIPTTEETITIEPTHTVGGGKGWITTHCNVDGASVSFDSSGAGCTVYQGECTVQVVTTGTPYRTFTVSKPGYQDYTASVTVWPADGQTVTLYATLNPQPPETGSIAVRSTPTGAQITLNGIFQGYAPLTIPDLAPASYTMAAKLDGYSPVSQYVTVNSGQTSYFTPQLQRSPQPPRDTGEVYIASSPSGAEVNVDSTYRGVTPMTVTLYPGNHNVLIRLSGYSDWTGTVYVTANSRQTMNAPLSRQLSYGWVTISSNLAGTNVYFDIAYKGQTDSSGSFTINGVSQGTHSLSLSHEGYYDFSVPVQVYANTEAYVTAVLTPVGSGPTPTQTPAGGGAINVVSTPAGAEVYLDNAFKGVTPVVLTGASPGSHVVMLKSAGYQDSFNTVQVGPGTTLQLEVTLNAAPVTKSAGSRDGIPAAIAGALVCALVLISIRRRS